MYLNKSVLWLNLLMVIILAGCGRSKAELDSAIAREEAEYLVAIQKLEVAEVYPIALEGELSDTIMPFSAYTDVSRDKMREKVLGRVVQWTFPVYDISLSDGIYKISSRSKKNILTVYSSIKARSIEDKNLLESLKTNDLITLKGIIYDISLRAVIDLVPAIIIHRNKQGVDIKITQDPEIETPKIEQVNNSELEIKQDKTTSTSEKPVEEIKVNEDKTLNEYKNSNKVGGESSNAGSDISLKTPANTTVPMNSE